jgi:predicted  nucleic acid-binding Zn-ribbon protein
MLEDKKMIMELTRDQNNIRNNLSKAQKINDEQNNEVIKTTKEKQKLDSDINGYKKEIDKWGKGIYFHH